jgi:hypothetical protein
MPIFIPLICLMAMGLALFRRSVPLSPAGRAVREDVVFACQGDNDPALFWAYLVAALNTAAPRGDTGAPWLLQPPAAGPGGPRRPA